MTSVPLLIGGEDVAAASSFAVHDPGRRYDVVAEVGAGRPSDVDDAVAAAERGGAQWARVPTEERCRLLVKLSDELRALTDELAPTLARENGATLREARMDLERGLDGLRSAADVARDHLRPREVDTPEHWLRFTKKPVGVVGMIVPWNSPIVLSLCKVGPALAAGNGIVLKPSPEAPVVLTRLLREIAAALPAGALNVVNGDADVGEAISGHPRVRMVSFTGSVPVGRAVLRGGAENIKRVALELGGNDAAIVLDDADVETVVSSLSLGAFTRAGQVCFAVKRAYLARARYDEFFEALRARVDGLRVGHGLDPDSSFGPLINERARERVQGLIERARAAGDVHELGRYVDDQTADNGSYLLPSIVRDVAHEAEIVAVEQFGPVLPLVAYDSVDEAVTMANDSEFGLASSVWSTDIDRAVQVADRLEAGVGFVNSHNVWSLSFDMPFGGVKQSGLGRERTETGVQEYVEDHVIRVIKPAPAA
ncbi:aldehyde dehydrogenase family protein [Pseudonocardia benzenivorans]|uniref:Aldehyde dehydrogenase family protein n=1 Tax=Pseudonocardia benzenivorans TaxID=228005 RepID=A0ABW3VFK2_9PSEU